MTRILVLGTADWNQPIATNQHYMVRELARAFPVLFTESMGLRTPELSVRDARRIAARVGLHRTTGALAPSRPVPAGVEVRSPRVLPRHVGLAARFNRPRMRRLVQDWIDDAGPKVLWTYSPVTYGLEEIADHVVYHCVDLLGEVDGISSSMIADAERILAGAPTVAIGTSPVVVDHLRSVGFEDVRHWPNVADTEVIAAAKPAVVARTPRRAVFAGNLSTTKVDFALLADLLRAGVDLHLAGPVSEGGGNAQRHVDGLVDAGAVYHGMLAPRELAELYWTAEVGLIPYVLNDYTRGVSPLKTYEYLAAGLAVVSTPVPSVVPERAHVRVSSSSEFPGAVEESLSWVQDETETRVALAEAHSWTGRGAVGRALVEAQVAEGRHQASARKPPSISRTPHAS